MGQEKNKQDEIFSQAWYNEYFQRAIDSPTHSRFCEEVYGIDLCQHGLMDMEELDFLTTLIQPEQRVLEIGCSNGLITRYIHRACSCSMLGIDFSDTAIEQARRYSENLPGLQFECVDLTRDPLPDERFDVILSIDSIYFLGEFRDTIKKLHSRLVPDGTLILCAFDVLDDEDPRDILGPGNTWVAQALTDCGLKFEWHDFTGNVRRHGPLNHATAEQMKDDFFLEENGFLYEARAAENTFFKEAAERELIVRYLYRTL